MWAIALACNAISVGADHGRSGRRPSQRAYRTKTQAPGFRVSGAARAVRRRSLHRKLPAQTWTSIIVRFASKTHTRFPGNPKQEWPSGKAPVRSEVAVEYRARCAVVRWAAFCASRKKDKQECAMDWNRIEGNWSSRAEPRRSGVGSLTMTSTLSTGAKSSLRVRSRNATGLPRTRPKRMCTPGQIHWRT